MTATGQATQAAPLMPYYSLEVTGVRRLTPHLVRIGFTGGDLREFPSGAPDQYVKLFFPLPGQAGPQLPPPLTDDSMSWYRRYLAMPDDVRPPMRTYTIRRHRPERAELEIDFVLHGDSGPASAWAQAAAPGDRIAMLGPGGLYGVPADTDWQLLVGDATAVPAIGAILEALPEGARVRAYVEVDGPEDELDLPSQGAVELTWLHRGTAAYGETLLAALRSAELPAGTPYGWLAGEAGMVKLARRHLVQDRGFDKRAITFTGYWRVGRTEEDTGRENVRKLDAGEPLDDDA